VKWIRDEIEQSSHLTDTVCTGHLRCNARHLLLSPIHPDANRARTVIFAAPHETSATRIWTGWETEDDFKRQLSSLRVICSLLVCGENQCVLCIHWELKLAAVEPRLRVQSDDITDYIIRVWILIFGLMQVFKDG
jgi:hypothetical protein